MTLLHLSIEISSSTNGFPSSSSTAAISDSGRLHFFTGGVRCLSILNVIFAVVFGLLGLFLGSSLLTLGSSCAVPLFWCYEISSWGLVALYGGTAFFLRRKAPAMLDKGDLPGRGFGLEMLGPAQELSPEMERRVNEGFKAWMGSSLLSSEEEEEEEDGGPGDDPDHEIP